MEPWFDEQTAGIVGGILGIVIGIWGGCVVGGMSAFYVNKGLKNLAYCLYGFTFFCGIVLVLIGCFALLAGQPSYVGFPFLLCGAITTGVVGAVIPVIRKRFADREKQIMAIEDL